MSRCRCAVTLLALAFAACQSDRIHDVATPIDARPAHLAGDILAPVYAGEIVSFWTANPSYEWAVDQAAAFWNDAYTYAQSPYGTAPVITTGSSNGTVQIEIVFDLRQSGSVWCGQAPVIQRVGSGGCAWPQSNVVTDLVGLIAHEMGHLLGWSHLRNHADLAHADSLQGHCAMYVPDTGVNGGACEYEKQWAYFKYGARDSVNMNVHLVAAAMFSLNGDTIPANDSIFVPITYEGDPGIWLLPPPAQPTITPSWSSTGLVSFGSSSIGGVWVRAGSTSGNTTITGTLSGSDPNVLWSPTSQIQAQASFWIAPPPPPPPPVVASIELSTYSVHLGYPNPHSANIYATAKDSQGNVIPNVTFTWTLSKDDAVWLGDFGHYANVHNKDPGGTAWLRASVGSVQSTHAAIVVDCSLVPCP